VVNGLTAAAIAILWDADHAAMRDKWERAKLAWFGPWSPQSGSPGETMTRFTAREFSGGHVVSAIRYGVSDPSSYCYAARTDHDRGVDEHALVATRSGVAPIAWRDLTDAHAALFGLDSIGLRSIARALCRI